MFWPDKRDSSVRDAVKPAPKSGYAAGQLIEDGGIRLRLKVNARARRISLRIDNKTGEAVVSAPRPRDLNDAVRFALSRRAWIIEKIADVPAPKAFQPGQSISLMGRTLALRQAPKLAAARLITEGYETALSAGGEGDAFHRRIERYLRKEALSLAQAYVGKYAQALGYEGVSVAIFDPKGRWGSCTPGRRAIRISWRLILAPPSVFDYVCAHEAAHLKHPHHGPAFWAEVERLFGDHEPSRRWLRSEGAGLFTYAA